MLYIEREWESEGDNQRGCLCVVSSCLTNGNGLLLPLPLSLPIFVIVVVGSCSLCMKLTSNCLPHMNIFVVIVARNGKFRGGLRGVFAAYMMLSCAMQTRA